MEQQGSHPGRPITRLQFTRHMEMEEMRQVRGGRCPARTTIEVKRKVQEIDQVKYLQINFGTGTHGFQKSAA
ncbi:hypothetical protein PAXRUDRAFT_827963 [Paxillus rubicundulus Ve08.2h10]|uniref:Uncharacterized protein n=1 Tax=Paxillus rubicundulus Ve08.2h10 TaxID=930991 RepID=A0A0D0DBF4_9AGAM|nr:hypothetical protein PAXRUDRAFT_827963 [Paxillus rubicundulus Ve08.2h10]